MLFCLVSETPLIKPSDLHAMCAPLNIYMQHVATGYMESAASSVVVIDRSARVPKGAMAIVCVEDGDDPNTIAHHYYDHVRDVPAARVFAANTTGMTAGGASVFESICHEMAEAEINPYLAVWADLPGRPGVQVAYECCDPTQDTYTIEHKGTKWPACNFVTPHWYRIELLGRPTMLRQLEDTYGYGLDWCKRLRTPGEIGYEGYAVMRRARSEGAGYVVWSEDSRGRLEFGARKLANKHDKGSRTRRLGGT